MYRSGDICLPAEANAIGRKWRRRGRSQEDDHSLTFDANEFGVREPNSAEIGLADFEKRSNRQTHRQTDRQTDSCFIYIYIYIRYQILQKLLGYKSCRLTGDEMGFGLIFFKFGIDLNTHRY